MKCPKCGKEIANDSIFCEFCGAQIAARPQQVSSVLVAWIMFVLVICSAVEMSCVECLNRQEMEYPTYVAEGTVRPSFLLIAFTNISIFVISIVLERKKQLRKSTSIALCLMSACIAFGAIVSALTMAVVALQFGTSIYGIQICDELLYASIVLAAVIAGVYGIYWLIAKAKHIIF